MDANDGAGSDSFSVVAMNAAGTFGTMQAVESSLFFSHLGPPEDMSNLLVFDDNGVESVGFLGVNSTGTNGTLKLYYAPVSSLTPTFVSQAIGGTSPVVIDSAVATGLSTALNTDGTSLFALWTCSGQTPDWDFRDGLGVVLSASAALTDLTTWTGQASTVTPVNTSMGASQVSTWFGQYIQVGVFGGFAIGGGTGTEEANFGVLGTPSTPPPPCTALWWFLP
jgi:hypothetical protein